MAHGTTGALGHPRHDLPRGGAEKDGRPRRAGVLHHRPIVEGHPVVRKDQRATGNERRRASGADRRGRGGRHHVLELDRRAHQRHRGRLGAGRRPQRGRAATAATAGRHARRLRGGLKDGQLRVKRGGHLP